MFVFAKKWNPLVQMSTCMYIVTVGTKVFCRKTLRPQIINWQDWKYTSYVVSCQGQNIQRHNLLGKYKLYTEILDWNSNFKAHFQSFDLSFTLILQMDNDFNSINYYVTIKHNDNVLCCFVSYLEHLSYRNIFCSLHKTRGLKIVFEIGISIRCFQRCTQQVSLHPLDFVVECFGCNRWKSQTMNNSNLAS